MAEAEVDDVHNTMVLMSSPVVISDQIDKLMLSLQYSLPCVCVCESSKRFMHGICLIMLLGPVLFVQIMLKS